MRGWIKVDKRERKLAYRKDRMIEVQEREER